MKLFLTGATGFVCEALIPLLQDRGHEVSALVRYCSTRDREQVEKMLPGVEIHPGDILFKDTLRRALTEAKPEIIVNLAAQSSVEYSFTHPEEAYLVNFMGVVNLSMAAKEVLPRLHRFVQISSVETYGNQEVLPLREDMKLNPAAPYGVAKASAEYHLHSMKDFPFVIVRNANSFGRKRNAGFVVERIISQLLSGRKTVKMGEPDSMRDFYYVDDEADFFYRAITKDGIEGETINSGTGEPISIRDLFGRIEQIMGMKAEKTEWRSFSPRPNEIAVLTMDISKAKRLLDWEPRTSLHEGLRRTVDYWRGKMITA